jgi:hypothetical protein
VPTLSLTSAWTLRYWSLHPSAWRDFSVTVLVIGIIAMPVSIYRMGRSVARLRLHATPHRGRKTHVAGLRAAAMVAVPAAALLYFQHSLNRICQEIAAPARLPRAASTAAPTLPMERPDASVDSAPTRYDASTIWIWVVTGIVTVVIIVVGLVAVH